MGYAKKSLKCAEDLKSLFATDMKMPILERPEVPDDDADETDMAIWNEDIKDYAKRKRALRGNLAAIQAVIWGQCSEAMKAKLKSIDGYEQSMSDDDCEWMLKNIKAITMQFDAKHNGYISMLDATAGFLNCRQQQGQTADSYLEALKGHADTIEYHGGILVLNQNLVPTMKDDGITPYTDDERKKIGRDCTLGAAFIRGADPTRYGALIADLANQYNKGKDEYPKDITAAYSMIVNYRAPTNAVSRHRGSDAPNTNNIHQPTTTPAPEGSALTFAQRNIGTPGVNGITHVGIVTCYRCSNEGHYASDCPTDTAGSTTTGTTLVQHGFMLAHGATGLNPAWILLDSQSTVSVFRNPDMLSNIRPSSSHVLRAVTNGGFQESTLVGDFPNLGEVWFNSQSIANILSLAEVRKVCRVTMDTAHESAMLVHRIDGSVMRFTEHQCGLFVYDSSNHSSRDVSAYSLVSTVSQQKKLFTRRDVMNADTARQLYRMLGRPSEAEYQRILANGGIRNCPVTPLDAQRALLIYGPDIATLKGKTTRTGAAPRMPMFDALPLPPHLLEHYGNVVLCIDFFFVQGHAFLHTVSRDIQFRTVSHVPDRKHATILQEVLAVIKLYHSRGFRVRDVHVDNEFACIRDDIYPIHLNVVAADSHVGEVERSIRTVKERLRACVHGLPFKRLPKLLLVHMVSHVIRCLNLFPALHGISDTLSPVSIVTGAPPADYNTFKLEFGTYVQLFDDPDPTNTIRARTLGAIALTPTGNAQGDYHFLSLSSGSRVARHRWTALPMTDVAIARVEALAAHERQPLIQASGLVVEWRPDHPVDDDEYDRDYVVPADDAAADAADDALLPVGYFDAIHPAELADLAAAAGPPDAPPLAPAMADQGANVHQHNDIVDDADSNFSSDYDYHDPGNHPTNDVDSFVDGSVNDDYEEEQQDDDENHINDDDEDQQPDAEPENGTNQGAQGAPPHRYSLRNRTDTATTRFRAAMDLPFSNKSYFPPTQFLYKEIAKHITITQMSANAGIKKHGRKAEEALMIEFAQLEELNVYEPLDPNTITHAQKKGALRAINLIKEKRCGRLKGRTVADGSTQRNLYDKSETASPTVATDALMVSIDTDAHEHRDVATADIAGAYLKAYMKDYVVMKFTGTSVDILCDMNQKYVPFVAVENGTKVLYVRLIKAIYGCVQSALLWYKMFHSHLKEIGFELNPYDPCIANKIIEGTQCTIAWYVDDTKISHVNPEVVTQVIGQIEERFGKMTVTRGRDHVFLGMKIAYKEDGTAEITMRDYLEEAIFDSNLDITRTAATPAKRDLFEISATAKPLDTKEAEVFHSVVAKLLYVSMRARMDILLAVSFFVYTSLQMYSGRSSEIEARPRVH